MNIAGRSAAQRWADGLAEWAIPEQVLEAAPQTPFVFSPAMFEAPSFDVSQRSLSSELAAAAVPAGGAVLDVGCGGGAAAFALAPPASRLVGSDRQQNMIDLFLATALDRGIDASGHVGMWPETAADVEMADVAVSHNVLYNAPDIVGFAQAMHDHARHRVVIEITELHPQTVRAPLWRHFWNIERPQVPTAWTARDALHEAGIPARAERSLATPRGDRGSPEVQAAFWTRMLCLPAERQAEVGEMLIDMEFPAERVVLWWDVANVTSAT